MDLGLRELTDDQLLELMQEGCREIARRDPYLRGMAQLTITTQAERVTVRRAMLKEAVTALAGAYVEQIRKETFDEVREGVRTGTVRLLTSAQEARVAVESTLEAKIKLIDETVAAIQQGPETRPEPWTIEPNERPRNSLDADGDYATWKKMRERQIYEEKRRMTVGAPPFYAPNPKKKTSLKP